MDRHNQENYLHLHNIFHRSINYPFNNSKSTVANRLAPRIPIFNGRNSNWESHMKNLTKTLIFTTILSLLAITLTIYIQINGETTLDLKCSYLDPIIIDILAFSVGLFLVIEGTARILEHPNASLKRQLTHPIRIAMGCAIVGIHILQFVHK